MTLKGVVLAGGTGSRLMPLTKVTNKHLLPVGQKPMIYYPIAKLLSAGIKEILIVTGVEHMGDVVNLLGSGKDFGCRFWHAEEPLPAPIIVQAQILFDGLNSFTNSAERFSIGLNAFATANKCNFL